MTMTLAQPAESRVEAVVVSMNDLPEGRCAECASARKRTGNKYAICAACALYASRREREAKS